jgi:CRP-like cAMP-binding protein
MRESIGRMSRAAIPRIKDRVLIGRLLIDMLRTIHTAGRRPSDKSKRHLNRDVEYILLSYAVLIGAAGGKPKTAAEIARFVDLPRATAQRKLGDLEKSGVVMRQGGKYHLTGAKMGCDQYVDKCLLLIKRAADRL